MIKLLFYFLDYLIILPSAFMCALPVLDHCRIKPRILFPSVSVGAVVFSFMLAFIRDRIDLGPNTPLLMFLVFALFVFFFAFDAKTIKLWYIFVSVVSVMSFGGLSTFFVDAMLDPDIEMIIELLVKWGISFVFFMLELIFLGKLRWLIDNENINTVWRFVWLIPMIITAANFLMIPEDYANVRIGKVFQLYIMIELLLAAFYIIYLIMLYRIAKAINDRAESEHNAQLLGLQAAQYDNLRKYLESTSRLRHDFVYMAKTAQSLAANGETEQLLRLLSDYGASIDATEAPAFYCENKALNAITDYYSNDARRKGIKFTAKLNVAQNIVISDYELCSIVGNVLDNAVAAAEKVTEQTPKILFVADTKPNGDLYIAVSNSYSGAIKEKGGKFSSTKSGGHGIGLESIRAIVSKNNGYCNFRYSDNTFYSEIMLRQE